MEKKQPTELKKVSTKLGKLFDLYPMEFGDYKEVTTAQRESLARMYGDTTLRSFLENSVRFANQNLIKSANHDQMLFYKARIETLMQLLTMGKQHFIHFEMLQRRVEKQPLQEKVNIK